MDAAEGSKSKKDNQIVFLNWKLAKPRMRFATGWVKAAEHRRTPKALRANTNHSCPVSRSFWSATRPRVAFAVRDLAGIWNLDFGFRWTGIEISREN
jgi:hypothetical protein